MKIGTYRALGGIVLVAAVWGLSWLVLQKWRDSGSCQVSLDVNTPLAAPEALVEVSTAEIAGVQSREAEHPPDKLQTSAVIRSLRPPRRELKRPPALSSDPEAIPGEWVLRFKDRGSMETFLKAPGRRNMVVVDVIPGLNAVRVRGVSRDDLQALAGGGDAEFEYSPDYYVRLPKAPASVQPRTEPSGGYRGFGLNAMSWLGVGGDRSKWGQGVKVAVLDSGVGQCQAIDENRVSRLDLLENPSDPGGGGNEHATAVAAILAGSIPGYEGMAPAAQILSIRIVGADGIGDSFTLAKSIETAVAQGVRIINICVGSRGDSSLVRQAVDHAIANGIVVVASAGNDGVEGISYPARYEGVLAVTAVDADGKHLYFANEGPEIGLAAPGLDVWAPSSTSTALRFSGTSASVPFVSGALASILSLEPGLNAREAAALLIRYSDDLGVPGKDPEFGSGIIDLQRVLNRRVGGIYDAALADNYLIVPSGKDAGLPPYVIVSVQNRGTERLSGAELRVQAGTDSKNMVLPSIDVGETVGIHVPLPGDRNAQQAGIKVVSSVVLPGLTDANSANNSKAGVVIVPGQDAPK